jgi:hypothetical protein
MAAVQRPGPADGARPMRADARRNSELLVATARQVFAVPARSTGTFRTGTRWWRRYTGAR